MGRWREIQLGLLRFCLYRAAERGGETRGRAVELEGVREVTSSPPPGWWACSASTVELVSLDSAVPACWVGSGISRCGASPCDSAVEARRTL